MHGGRDRTALQAAARRGYADIVTLLLDQGADVNAAAELYLGRTALGRVDIAKELLSRNANVNAAAAPYHGMTALQAAAASGNIQLAQLLLTNGAEVNTAAVSYYGRGRPFRDGAAAFT